MAGAAGNLQRWYNGWHMNAQDIRNAYLKFYEERGHAVIPRARLTPDNDPTTLFTGSGMQPLIPYLLGEPHPHGIRLADSQPCLRAQDIEEVGDNRHTTFFEMLGNWSLGDYTKEQQIPWMFEFLTSVVGIDPKRLYVTCFMGAPEYGIPKDTVAAELWQKQFADKGVEAQAVDIGSEEDGYRRGVKEGERIFYYDGSKNWWNRGKTGPQTTPVGDPCGPDSEMFFDFGDLNMHQQWVSEKISVAVAQSSGSDKELLAREIQDQYEHCHPNCDCGRFMEVGNNVFMAYRKVAEGEFVPLEKPNIDHGSGLERIAAAAIDSPDVFKISLLWPIVESVEKLSGKQYDEYRENMRVIADHLRAATFMAVDGIVPSNKQQGYVMRRLVRRAVRFAFDLGIEQNFLQEVVPVIADLYADDYPEVKSNKDQVVAVLVKEEKAFRQTLRKGLKEFDKMFQKPVKDGEVLVVNGEPVTKKAYLSLGYGLFKLYDTNGFPVELSIEELYARYPATKLWSIEELKGLFDKEMAEQRSRSQTAAKGAFKGGLGGQDLIHKKYHTATHLMYQALRDVLGDHVVQHGSNITEERLRFDFSHPEKVTPEQLAQVEAIVNEQIGKDLKVSFAEYPTAEATGPLGALGQFGDRYGDTVKVYKMIADGADKPFSFEICGGPHVDHTLQLFEDGKRFKILKEESSSAGIRRIKAVLA